MINVKGDDSHFFLCKKSSMLSRSYLVLQYLLIPVKSFHILHETTFLSKV